MTTPAWAATARLMTAPAALGLAAALASAPALAAIPAAERAALIALYNSTDGANWWNRAGWSTPASDACTWAGVTCSGPAGSEHVTALKLNFNNLTGTVPASLMGLTELTALNLRQNALTGPLPQLGMLGKLVALDLGNNQFSGPIPPLSTLADLETFEIQGGQLTGSIPDLSGLAKLKTFNVSGNQLDGQIGALAGATALETFNLRSNRLTGPIPDLTGLTALKSFDASFNRLTGITALAGLAHLDSFLAQSNQLEGPIPPLTGLPKLRDFHVEDNQLTGSIPDVAGLDSLVYFYVHQNQLTGQIPPSLAALTKLRFLQVHNNQLVGAPPLPPSSLEVAIMCPNPLRNSTDAAINAAWDPITGNGNNPWATGCTGSWDVTPTVRDAYSGDIITNGSTGTISPDTVQILPQGGGMQFTLTPAPGYRLRSQIDASCPGGLSGNTYTVANMTANCYINASFVPDVAPDNGVCGSDHGKILATAPTHLCTAGSASAVTGSGPWNWSCAGSSGGTTAQCTAQKAGSGTGLTVTAVVDGGGGTAAPASQSVANGARATITATPEPSYMLIGASGCGATFSGNTVTTAAVTTDCPVTLGFAIATATTTRFISLTPPAPRVNDAVAVRVAVDVGDTPLASGGTVNVSGGGATCAATIDTTGQGQCSLRFPTAGTHPLTAAYPGDPALRYLPSSAVRNVTVIGVQPVPTLGQWALTLLAALTGLLATLHLRRA